MIEYSEITLKNGLKVLAHRDPLSKLAAVNIIYCVGARNEDSHRTGFAHLFEHLMFRGTRRIPDYDIPVQEACGENNAFTTNDYTDFYLTLPKENIETALWLESDRMTGLDISPEHLDTEKMVVIEEFNQRYLNQPYGDQWLLLRELAYKVHPYRWPTIGRAPEHIKNATLKDVQAFYERYYQPSNAILSVAADMDPENIFSLAEKWFGELPASPKPEDEIPQEPEQTQARRLEVQREVPATQVTIAFVVERRLSREHYVCDLITDLFAGGTSSRLYERLVKQQKIFSAVNAYISGDLDRGLFVIIGQLLPCVSTEQGEVAVWGEIEKLKSEPTAREELEKVKNKFEAGIIFGELNVMNKALNLGYYSMLGDMSLLNDEVKIYRSIEADEVMEVSRRLLTRERSCTLVINPAK